jgi:D-serine dehydratase
MVGVKDQILKQVKEMKPVLWKNECRRCSPEVLASLDIGMTDIMEAAARLDRFAPFIRKTFPETGDGIIESPLRTAFELQSELSGLYEKQLTGKMFIKCDSELGVAGSIKARGGIYEVLKHAEDLLLKEGLLSLDDDYSRIDSPEFRNFFSRYRIAVGSTGNLGLSIGIISARLGFNVTVHMSNDAKEWKKLLLRDRGVTVVEHEDDYSKAVEEGRRECVGDPDAYFVDDENSPDLFLGYAVAALRLKEQLRTAGIEVDKAHPLYVYLPCGGAPGGITFGLKHLFGDNVHCFFVEPTHSPCMLLGMLTDDPDIRVNDHGIDNITEADGLAVGSPSNFVYTMIKDLIDGIYTIEDEELYVLLALLKDSENAVVEPSAASSLKGPWMIEAEDGATHIAWLTGGLFLPENLFSGMYEKGKSILSTKA